MTPTEREESMSNSAEPTVDLIVVGGGGSGLATAVSAAEHGASVVVLERCAKIGGTTAWSIGSMTAADTSLQRRKKIHDTADALVEDMWLFDPELLTGDEPSLRRLYAENSGKTIEWLKKHGVAFAGPFPEAPHRVPRMHNVIPNSRSYIARLSEAARRLGVEVRLESEVTKLIVEDDRIVGVVVTSPAGESRVTSRNGVVIATGDFSGADELRRENLSPAAASALPINVDSLGLGHILARDVGAELRRMDQIFGPQLRFPSSPKPGLLDRLPTWRWLCAMEGFVANNVPPSMLRPIVKSLLVSHMSPTDQMFRSGAILVNGAGERFGNEERPAAELSMQEGGKGYLILDASIARQYDTTPNHISTAPGIAFAYFSDYSKGRPDLVHRAATASALAAKLGVNAESLSEAVASSQLSGELIAMGPVFSMLTVTEGAIAVDDMLRVLRADGTAVEGLYSVGGAGQGGMLLKGHGHHIGWAMTSGRVLGRALAQQKSTQEVA
jgi:fumarate reductase flavoprotein subunit